MAAGRTCGIEVVEIGCMRTNQLDFKADQTALAMYLFKLRAKTARIRRIRLQEIAPVCSAMLLPLCTCPQDCKWLATRFQSALLLHHSASSFRRTSNR